jgi:putative phosphoesterase
MKIMIASDIHGSALWCGKLMEALKKEEPDRLLLLGDVLYHGPRNELPEEYAPKKVIAMLNGLEIPVYGIRGNCEAEVDQMVLNFPVMAEYMLLPAGERMIFATHGHVYNKGKLPPLRQGDVLLYGHTHVPLCEENGGVLCCNPGSVSIPKEGSEKSYMTLEDGVLRWKTLEGRTYMERELRQPSAFTAI